MASVGAKLSPLIPPPEPSAAESSAAATVDDHAVGSALFARRAILVFIDLACIWGAALLAIVIRFQLRIRDHWTLETHAAFLVLYSALIVLSCNAHRLYAASVFRTGRQESLAIVRAIGFASIVLATFIYITGSKMISRFVIALTMVLSLLAIGGLRYLRRRKAENAAADGFTCRNVLIVGTGLTAQALRQYLDDHRWLGYVPAGFIAADLDAPHPDAEVLGDVRDIPAVSRSRFIDEIIVTTANRNAAKTAITEARACGLGVRVIPDLYDGLAWGAPVEYVGQFPTICLSQKQIPAFALMLKRALDVTAAAAGLLLLTPLLAAVALAVRLDSPGPVFYTSDRVGRKGRVFGCHKFRTMVANADDLRARLQHLNERDGVLFKISNDPRITRVGRFLRKYSLDELPQLWNVIRGDMSLVGPRPPLAAEVKQYEIDHLRRLDVLPGITGLWQVEARTNPSFASYIALDLEYVERWNVLLDLRILLKTAAVVVAGTGN